MLHIGFEVIGKKEDVKKVQEKLLELLKRHDMLINLYYKFNDDKIVTVKPIQMDKDFDLREDEEFKKFYRDLTDLTEQESFMYVEMFEYITFKKKMKIKYQLNGNKNNIELVQDKIKKLAIKHNVKVEFEIQENNNEDLEITPYRLDEPTLENKETYLKFYDEFMSMTQEDFIHIRNTVYSSKEKIENSLAFLEIVKKYDSCWDIGKLYKEVRETFPKVSLENINEYFDLDTLGDELALFYNAISGEF